MYITKTQRLILTLLAIIAIPIVLFRVAELIEGSQATCISTRAMVTPAAQTYWDIAKQLCSGDSTSNIVDQIVELNPNLDPLNLQFGDIVNLPYIPQEGGK